MCYHSVAVVVSGIRYELSLHLIDKALSLADRTGTVTIIRMEEDLAECGMPSWQGAPEGTLLTVFEEETNLGNYISALRQKTALRIITRTLYRRELFSAFTHTGNSERYELIIFGYHPSFLNEMMLEWCSLINDIHSELLITGPGNGE